MCDGASEEVARCGAPRSVEEPREGDECKGEVRSCDGHDAEEGDARAWVSAGPDVDGYESEWGGEEGHVYEGR